MAELSIYKTDLHDRTSCVPSIVSDEGNIAIEIASESGDILALVAINHVDLLRLYREAALEAAAIRETLRETMGLV